jgi:hypothetical protein
MKESLTEEDKVNKTHVEEAKSQTRQSQRIKEQGLEGIKIADKAALVAQKKNLEGNHLKLKNSFAVLSNNELIVRAGKMGVETSRIDMEKIELIKDLEAARANMENRMEDTHESAKIENIVPLPLEEMKYIEWKSDSSDEEGFRVVSKKRSRKKNRKSRMNNFNKTEGVGDHPHDETSSFEGGSTRHCTKYNLRKGAAWKKINNDRNYLEL